MDLICEGLTGELNDFEERGCLVEAFFPALSLLWPVDSSFVMVREETVVEGVEGWTSGYINTGSLPVSSTWYMLELEECLGVEVVCWG